LKLPTDLSVEIAESLTNPKIEDTAAKTFLGSTEL